MAATARDNVYHLPSIQGEALRERDARAVPASIGDVDNYVDSKSQGILNCRSAGHIFPAQSKTQLKFTGYDTELKAFERRIGCVNGCGCIFKVELWQPRGSGKHRRWQMVGTKREEHTNADGETYAMKPGLGRAYRKDVKESMATVALSGVSPAQILKELGIKA